MRAGDQAKTLTVQHRGRFFQRTDWLSFGVTTALALVVYSFTLAPNVTLELSGIFSVGAMYAGVPHPPGYPLWTVYAWLFTWILPISNIAWRAAVSSAVAAALASGMVALMVSRGGAMIVEGISGFSSPEQKNEKALRVASGCVAGLAFGFDGGFWRTAVVASPWSLSLLLFSSVLCLLMRWTHAPGQKRYLYAASFVYGLTLTNSQALLAAAPGLQLLVMLGYRQLVREICLVNGALLIAGFAAAKLGYLEVSGSFGARFNFLNVVCFLVGAGSIGVCVAFAIRTRRLLTEWKSVLVSGVMFLFGLAAYLYVPIASMTNPPVNWSYARTVEGFVHSLSRGQYEQINPTNSVGRLMEQIQTYAQIAVREFGLVYLLVALVPLFFLGKMRTWERRWLVGLTAVYACLGFLLLVALNPSNDLESVERCKVFYSASHLVLAIWTGYGLMLIGVQFAKRRARHAGTITAAI